MLIVDPDRGNRAAFTRCMQGLGFTLAEERFDRVPPGAGSAFKGRLLAYQRKEGAARTMRRSAVDVAPNRRH